MKNVKNAKTAAVGLVMTVELAELAELVELVELAELMELGVQIKIAQMAQLRDSHPATLDPVVALAINHLLLTIC